MWTKGKLLYVGQTSRLKPRFRAYARKLWTRGQPVFSFSILPLEMPAYQRHELESDLLVCWFSVNWSFSPPGVSTMRPV
jgi:hypothetical protein